MKERLGVLLKARNMSREEFARQLGRPLPTVHNWLQGRSAPKPKDYPRLCEVLSISIGELVSDTPGIPVKRTPPTPERFQPVLVGSCPGCKCELSYADLDWQVKIPEVRLSVGKIR